jgi:ABC-type Mn2+/Zn2+ transport system permease subunit
MTENQRYWFALTVSLVVAYLGVTAPSRRMPLDYDAMISRSIPLAIVWAAMLGFSMGRFKTRGLWLLLASPFALYWPTWLLFNHFPDCYYLGNCS